MLSPVLSPVYSLFHYNWFCNQDIFSNQMVKQECGTWWLEIIKPHGNRVRTSGTILGVERLNASKSDFEMPDKLDTRPSGSDLHHLFLVGMELCLVILKKRQCRSTTRRCNNTRMVRDMNDVAEGCLLPKQIFSETTVAEPDRYVGKYSQRWIFTFVVDSACRPAVYWYSG